MLSLTTLSLSACSPAISSRTGATWRHGPHHSAQKSTSTGRSACRTSEVKLWSVTALVLAPIMAIPFECFGYGNGTCAARAEFRGERRGHASEVGDELGLFGGDARAGA